MSASGTLWTGFDVTTNDGGSILRCSHWSRRNLRWKKGFNYSPIVIPGWEHCRLPVDNCRDSRTPVNHRLFLYYHRIETGGLEQLDSILHNLDRLYSILNNLDQLDSMFNNLDRLYVCMYVCMYSWYNDKYQTIWRSDYCPVGSCGKNTNFDSSYPSR